MIVSAVALPACSDDDDAPEDPNGTIDKNAVIGIWDPVSCIEVEKVNGVVVDESEEGVEYVYSFEFFSDGTYSAYDNLSYGLEDLEYTAESGEYYISGNKLTLKQIWEDGNSETFEYKIVSLTSDKAVLYYYETNEYQADVYEWETTTTYKKRSK